MAVRILRRRRKLKFTTEKNLKAKRVKAFVISFVCFVLLFGSVSFLMLLHSLDYDLSNLVGGGDITNTTEEQEETTSITDALHGTKTFFVSCTGTSGEITFAAFIKADFENSKITVTALDPASAADANGFEGKLTEHYQRAGIRQLTLAAESITGFKADRYISFTEANFKRILRAIGDITVNVHRDIYLSGSDVILELKAGEQKLSPDTLLKYIKYGEKGNALIPLQEKVISYIVKSLLTPQSAAKIDRIFSDTINLVETNISVMDFNENKPVFELFSRESVQYANLSS